MDIKIALLIASIMVAAPAQATHDQGPFALKGCNTQDLGDAQSFHDTIVREVTEGRGSQIDYRLAEAALLDVRLCAGNISLQDYCRARSFNLEKIRSLYRVRGMLPQGYFVDLVQARSRCDGL